MPSSAGDLVPHSPEDEMGPDRARSRAVKHRGFIHVALRVDGLEEAERYYRTLLGLEVAYRESEANEGWSTLPEGIDWGQAKLKGVRPGVSVLHSGNLILALSEERVGVDGGRLDHVGIAVDETTLTEIRERTASLGCLVVQQRSDLLIIEDQYAVRWELTSGDRGDPRLQSHGARQGRWLHLESPSHPSSFG